MKRKVFLFGPSFSGCLLVASLLSSCNGVHLATSVLPAEESAPVTTSASQPLTTSAVAPRKAAPGAETLVSEAPSGQAQRQAAAPGEVASSDVVLLPAAEHPLIPTQVQYGVASWYGQPFHGRPTASGEIYNMHKTTAAHRTVALGTRAVVTNLENGSSIEVLINDRGPYIYNRVLDLSYGAAQQLDMVHDGLVRVKVEFLPKPPSVAKQKASPVTVAKRATPSVSTAVPTPQPVTAPMVASHQTHPGVFAPGYTVEIGTFRTPQRATQVQHTLAAYHGNVSVTPMTGRSQTLYRVQVGAYVSREEATSVARQVETQGYAPTVVPLEH